MFAETHKAAGIVNVDGDLQASILKRTENEFIML